MKAQILLRGGPWDMNLVTYTTAPNADEFPVELRVGSHDEFTAMEEGQFHAAVYRRIEVEEMPVSLMWYGGYDFVAMQPTTKALVDVWVP